MCKIACEEGAVREGVLPTVMYGKEVSMESMQRGKHEAQCLLETVGIL